MKKLIARIRAYLKTRRYRRTYDREAEMDDWANDARG